MNQRPLPADKNSSSHVVSALAFPFAPLDQRPGLARLFRDEAFWAELFCGQDIFWTDGNMVKVAARRAGLMRGVPINKDDRATIGELAVKLLAGQGRSALVKIVADEEPPRKDARKIGDKSLGALARAIFLSLSDEDRATAERDFSDANFLLEFERFRKWLSTCVLPDERLARLVGAYCLLQPHLARELCQTTLQSRPTLLPLMVDTQVGSAHGRAATAFAPGATAATKAPTLASPSAGAQVDDAPCQRERLNQHTETLVAFKSRFTQVAASAQCLVDGKLELPQLKQLAAEAGAAADLVAGLGFLREFSTCSKACPGFDKDCQSLAERAEKPHMTVSDTLEQMSGLATLRVRLDRNDETISECEAELFRLAEDLGREAPARRIAGSLRASVDEAGHAHVERERWQKAHAAEFMQQQAALLDALESARAKFGYQPQQAQRIAALTGAARTSASLTALSQVRAELEATRPSWRAQRGLEELSREALRAGTADSLTAVASELLRQRRPEAALILLVVTQQSLSVEALADANVVAFMSLTARAMAEASQADERIVEFVPDLLSTCWLPLLRREDLPDDRAVRPLLLLYLAAARHRDDCLSVCHEFQLFSAISERSALGRIAIALRERTPWSIVMSDPAQQLAEARARVQQVVDSPFAQVFRKANNAHRFSEPLNCMKEAFQDEWRRLLADERISRAEVDPRLRKTLEASWGQVEAVLHGDRSETFFRELIRESLDQALNALSKFLDTRAAVRSGVQVTAADLQAELTAMAAPYEGTLLVFDLAWSLLSSRLIPPSPYSNPLSGLLLKVSPCAYAAPRLASQASCTADWAPDGEAVKEVLSALETTREEIEKVLLDGCCFDVLNPDWRSADGRSVTDLKAAQRSALDKLEGLPEAGFDRTALIRAFERGCFGIVQGEVQRLEHHRTSRLELDSANLKQRLRALRGQFNDLSTAVDEGTFDQDWRAQFGEVREKIDAAFRLAVPPEQTLEKKQEAVDKLAPCVEQLQAMVKHNAADFAGLRALVKELAPAPPAAVDDRALKVTPGMTFASGRALVWKLFDQVAVQADFKDDTSLLNELAHMAHMYKTGGDRDGVRVHKVTGLPQQGLLTRFTKPKATHFQRPMYLVILRGAAQFTTELVALEADMDRSEASREHYVLLAPTNSDELQRKLRKRLRDGRATIIGRAQLRELLEAENIGPRFRQLMRRSISVEIASPYRSEGHVSADENIYVGRRELLNLLTTSGKSFAIWAGRRSGKTSLLHAARQVFQKQDETALVVYESAQGLTQAKTADLEALDLQLAARITHALRLGPPPASLEEFHARMDAACARQPIVLLLDEVDEYVAPHLARNNYEFGLIDQLRALRNKHSARFLPIFAGFKYLFEAVALVRRHEDPGYPWQNFVSPLPPLSSLSIDETTELVHEGFAEVLGFDYEPTVPRLIFEKTGGHPALVQQFADSLLHRIADSARTNPNRKITASDVENTFAESESRQGYMPYVQFVGQTLDMNLGNLERIIIYVVAAVLIGRNGDGTEEFERSQIESAVNQWFSTQPSRPQFDRAFENLKMTSMLVLRENRFYRIAFPSYARILIRLEEATRDKIETLVAEGLGE